MDITGLGWCCTRTERGDEPAYFNEHVLGLRPVLAEPDLWVFELRDGRHVEVFDPHCPGKDHFDTGQVVGFAVRTRICPGPSRSCNRLMSNCSESRDRPGNSSEDLTRMFTSSLPADITFVKTILERRRKCLSDCVRAQLGRPLC